MRTLFVLMFCFPLMAEPARADEEASRVSEEELRAGCDFEKSSWEQGLSEPIAACAAQCFKAYRMVGVKAGDYQRAYRLSLWVGFGVTALVGAILLTWWARFGGHKGLRGWQMLAGQLVWLLLAFGAGFGAQLALASSKATAPATAMFWDLWHMKHAGKTGTSFTGETFMSCSDKLLPLRMEAEGDNLQLLTPFAAYPGVFERFPQLPTDKAAQKPDIDRRWADMTKVASMAEEIAPTITETDVVPFDSGPVRQVRELTPFPTNFWLAGALGVVLAYLLSLALQLVFRR